MNRQDIIELLKYYRFKYPQDMNQSILQIFCYKHNYRTDDDYVIDIFNELNFEEPKKENMQVLSDYYLRQDEYENLKVVKKIIRKEKIKKINDSTKN